MASYHVEIKSGKKGAATEHAKYISRYGRRSTRGDLVGTGYGNLPTCAEGQPLKFWGFADKYERINAAVYRELVIAIPEEFDLDQAKAFVEQVVTNLIGNRPYQYALHAPGAALDEGVNLHVHLMYSDRVPDGIDRPPERMFARFNRKHPEDGGRRKASGGMNSIQLRDDLIAKRKVIADIQNRMLQEAGHDAQVDHRSHRERGIAKRPERHLGPARINRMSHDEKLAYTASREGRRPQSRATLPQL